MRNFLCISINNESALAVSVLLGDFHARSLVFFSLYCAGSIVALTVFIKQISGVGVCDYQLSGDLEASTTQHEPNDSEIFSVHFGCGNS